MTRLRNMIGELILGAFWNVIAAADVVDEWLYDRKQHPLDVAYSRGYRRGVEDERKGITRWMT
ncbi:hypothetical protein [Gordonia tangerina]|uniref:Uncharacterized protein n=1 Tax=Gordonia tangerina TaxID=2911060 RepID=A0ABS9DMW6_9ACTN|nr:hypothetical protein [Gordonia tangerina]MCF3939939.1 hypothetical protein [Gordonia tangerina]